VTVTDQVLTYDVPPATPGQAAATATAPLPASIPEPSVLSLAGLVVLGLALKYLPRRCRPAARGSGIVVHSPS